MITVPQSAQGPTPKPRPQVPPEYLMMAAAVQADLFKQVEKKDV